MRRRCNNPKDKNYYLYGAKGIKMCQRWMDSFHDFLEDVGPRPTPEHVLKRLDVKGDYSPDNVRWWKQGEDRNPGVVPNYKKPEYNVWEAIVQRCCNPNNQTYPGYGGRGITICDRWRNSFDAFLEDMGERPEPKHLYSIDRIDNDGNYEPGNCRWTTQDVQANNTRRNRYALVRGEYLTVSNISKKYQIPHNTISRRIEEGKLDEELIAPIKDYKLYDFNGEKVTLKDLSKATGVAKHNLYHRLVVVPKRKLSLNEEDLRYASHTSWASMIQRCTNPNDPNYPLYGARGITVCDRWKESYDNYRNDLGPRPEGKRESGRSLYSVARIDTNGHYEPSNCEWAHDKKIHRNKKNTVWLDYEGELITTRELSDRTGVSIKHIYERYKKGFKGKELLLPNSKSKSNI
jgi:hypothetical protein